MSKTITLNGKDAINVSNIQSGGKAGSITLSPGKYAVNMVSTVKFHDDRLKLDQVVIFNCAPLNTQHSEKWYFVVNTSEGIQITAEENRPIYAVILDQLNSDDNTGSLTVSFTPLPA
jgi:hypothetical protein